METPASEPAAAPPLLLQIDQPHPSIFTAALVGAALLHGLAVLAFSLKPPAPQAIPETALEVLILKEGARTLNEAMPDSVLAQKTQAGDALMSEPAGSIPENPASHTDEAPEESAPEEPPPEETDPDQQPPEPEPAADTAPPGEPLEVLTAKRHDAPQPDDLLASLAPPEKSVNAAQILASQSREIERLTKTLEARSAAYAKRVRRKPVSARTREYRYASYLTAWARKVERIGNINYPQAAKDGRIYGSLILHVSIRSDGSVEQIRVVRSSGYEVLDDAAIQIVELAAPYSPFPPDIAAETDVLDITRTWQFMRGNVLGWER